MLHTNDELLLVVGFDRNGFHGSHVVMEKVYHVHVR